MGISGRLSAYFLNSRLTPLLALMGLLLGVFAALITPREEEPQINVTMANVFVPFPGASAKDVEQLVTTPLERLLGEIQDVEHLYSASSPGMAVLTVQFEVGVERTEALVRLYNAVYSNVDWRPANLGLGPIVIKPKGIDDVPIMALTLFSAANEQSPHSLRKIAQALETELKRIPGTRDVETIGAGQSVIRVLLDPQKVAALDLTVVELEQAIIASNRVEHAGAVIGANQLTPVTAGTFLASRDDVAELVIGVKAGRPVYLEDVAQITDAAAEISQYVWHADKQGMQPAVTLAISKKPGENAVDIAHEIESRLVQLKHYFIPEGVSVEVSRNYGQTADEKARQLIQKLIFATLSVIALVLFTLGRREAIVVGAAVVLTLLVTLFASWAWGFTLNRVSLFALIFSIGILVDDAIVVVENIHRHQALGERSLWQAIPLAVDEVGGPTILATLTVIAALLPMAFVTGLMGPYMSPIPINASMGMLLSLVIAFTFTPWLAARLFKDSGGVHAVSREAKKGVFVRLIQPFLGQHRSRRYLLGFSLLGLIGLAISLAVMQWVVLKMLPFDNKSEFQVVVDMPEGSPVEETNRVLVALNQYLLTVPEVAAVQGYAGTAAPIGFNGLVRQYYLRQSPHQGELQVNLLAKQDRERDSHTIATSIRPELETIARPLGASIKVVEVPPGPPVMAPLVAEIYGPDAQGQYAWANTIAERFTQTSGVVDVDTSIEASAERWQVRVDRARAALLGVSQADIAATLAMLLQGSNATYLQNGLSTYPIPVQLALSEGDKATVESLLSTKIRTQQGGLIALADVVNLEKEPWEKTIYHKDLLPVVYVTGDAAGALDSPLYAMFTMAAELPLEQFYIQQPEQTYDYALKWDGEWQITYETFRDMGAAYSVGLLLIYLLVVAQFGSYRVPLVIMAPIPLTLIGIMPGHALLGAQFTATSMIGMIALAGIIVRNSILLVDFINQQRAAGVVLEEAVLNAAHVRAKPILLTAVAAMMGAFFILDDPIFNGLAISLIFGLLVSTLLTLWVIPLLYYSLLRRKVRKSNR